MPQQSALPQKQRDYTNHVLLDSTRWDAYKHRPGDIVISTSYKTGTTWTQTIVANLIFQDGAFPDAVSSMSPWLDMALPPLDQVCQALESQTHRRFIKSHLALDGLPYFESARYIVVCRDVRDVFMSIWNHHAGYSDHAKANFSQRAASLGCEFPLAFEDIHDMWRQWIDRSAFEWESSGYPYWSHLHHAQTWWEYRHLPNILLVHYSDLLQDPEGQVRRIAKFLDIVINEQFLPDILKRISFSGMKDNFRAIMPEADQFFLGGGATFMNKGTNGRWQNVLTQEELEQCRAATARELTQDCATWLERGGEYEDAAKAVRSGA